MATRIEQLTSQPLLECPQCGRLVFCPQECKCGKCLVQMVRVDEPTNEQTQQALELHFEVDTTLGYTQKRREHFMVIGREQAWDEWNRY